MIRCKNKECGSINIVKNGSGRYHCKDCHGSRVYDDEIEGKSVELANKVQKLADSNRIERKAYREHARISNALEIYSKELIKVIKRHPFVEQEYPEVPLKGAVLFVQLSDPHFNELICLPNNRYDFTIASQRLKEYANRIKKYAQAVDCKKIVFVATGDLLNSDRRLDELLNQATNRAKASYLSYKLLRYFIEDLALVAPISIYSVTGNESRANKELGFSAVTASDNYDVTIMQMIKIAFDGSERVKVFEGDPNEQVIEVDGQYFLLMHGTTMGNSNTQQKIAQIIGKHALKGILLRFVFYGHVHSANISDYSGRSSSLAGSNTYNEIALNLVGRASQNIYILYEGGIFDAIRVDLQGEFEQGYPVDKELEAYHAKSADKLKQNETIFRVVI